MFDSWTHDDFAQHVYNADYPRHDPEYLEIRPQQHADLICTSFPEMREGRVLDFGSGLGLLERKLVSRGFTDVTSYDPFSHPVPPEGRFDTILSFEVFEHHPAPVDLFDQIMRYRKPDGALLFQTSLITRDILDQGIDQWWYCVPRNGQYLVSHRPVPDAACPTTRARIWRIRSVAARRLRSRGDTALARQIPQAVAAGEPARTGECCAVRQAFPARFRLHVVVLPDGIVSTRTHGGRCACPLAFIARRHGACVSRLTLRRPSSACSPRSARTAVSGCRPPPTASASRTARSSSCRRWRSCPAATMTPRNPRR